MNFFGKLNAKNTFGMFEQGKGNNIVNIICGVLLIILIIVLIICLVGKNDNFSNQKVHSNDLNNCEVLMFDREGCGFSAKMKKIVKDNNNMIGDMKVCIIDMIKEQELAKRFNVTGTPTFALKNNPEVVSVGFKPSLDLVLQDLKHNNSNSKLSEKEILFIGNMKCPFCRKAKELMDELQIDYNFIESSLPDAIKHMKESNSNGVPLIKHKSGYIKGYNEQEIRNLKK